MKRRSSDFIIISIYAAAVIVTTVLVGDLYVGPSSIAFAVIGLIVCSLVTSLAHETGHALAARLNGFKTVVFSFFIFTFDRASKRRFGIRFTDYSGETDILPVKGDRLAQRYRRSLVGGLIGGLIAAAALALSFFLTRSVDVKLLFAAFPFSFASLLLNAIPLLIPTSDGSAIFFLSTPIGKDRGERYLGILYRLGQGETFAEMPDELFESCNGNEGFLFENLTLCALMRAEEKGDYEDVKSIAEKLNGIDRPSQETLKELLYAYSVTGNGKGVEEVCGILRQCDEKSDAIDLRVLVAYAKYRGDDKYVEIAKPTALKACDDLYPAGERKFNAKLIEKL